MGFFKNILSNLLSGKSGYSSDEIIEAYSGVCAGVEINKKCSLLSADEEQSLNESFNQFTIAIDGIINKQYLMMICETSKEMANDLPYNQCGIEAQSAISEAQEVVIYWLNELSKNKS